MIVAKGIEGTLELEANTIRVTIHQLGFSGVFEFSVSDVVDVACKDGGGLLAGHIRLNVPQAKITGHYPFKSNKEVVGVNIRFRKNHDAFREIYAVVAGPLERARALRHASTSQWRQASASRRRLLQQLAWS